MYSIYIAFSLYSFRVILIIVQETPNGAWTWSVIFGYVALFWQPITPTADYADNPLLRQPITPTTHYSDSP